MNYYSKTVYFVHDLYPLASTIQLHQQIMESQPSTTTTSTKTKQDNMPSSQSTSVDKTSTTPKTNPTLSIPNPIYSPLIQQLVTNAAAMIASNHLTRNMFIVEVFKKCSEIALWEKRTGKTAPELLPESPKLTGESPQSSHSYFSDVQHITPEGDDVLNRYIKKYSMPKISTATVTVSSTLGEETPSTTTSNPTEGSTPHAECTVNKTSDFIMMNNVEQSLPNQARTLFAPVGIAEGLANIQLILCEEIKTEIQAVKESIATIPFDDVQRKITEATTLLEERMTRLEEQYGKLKDILKQRTRQKYTANPALLEQWNPGDMFIQDEIIGVTSKTTTKEANFSPDEFSIGYKTTAKPLMSESVCEPSLHSRDKSEAKSTNQKVSYQKKNNNDSKPDDAPMNLEVDTKEDKSRNSLGTPKKKNRGIWLYCTSSTGKLYAFKYFKAYPYDHRMLVKDDYGEPIRCHYPEGKIHHVQCPWYHPDVIYIVDFQEDLSSIELSAQQKIYNIYQNTIHYPPEHCGCGIAAEIAYMGHTTGCFKFKYIHERESYEVLLAILQKTEKVTGCPTSRKKKPRLQFSKHDAKARGDSEENLVVQKVQRANEVPFNLSQKSKYSFPLIADTVDSTSIAALPND